MWNALFYALLCATATYFTRHWLWAFVQALGLLLRRRLSPSELMWGTLAMVPVVLASCALYAHWGWGWMATAFFFSIPILFALGWWMSSEEERLASLQNPPIWAEGKPADQLLVYLAAAERWWGERGYQRTSQFFGRFARGLEEMQESLLK